MASSTPATRAARRNVSFRTMTTMRESKVNDDDSEEEVGGAFDLGRAEWGGDIEIGTRTQLGPVSTILGATRIDRRLSVGVNQGSSFDRRGPARTEQKTAAGKDKRAGCAPGQILRRNRNAHATIGRQHESTHRRACL